MGIYTYSSLIIIKGYDQGAFQDLYLSDFKSQHIDGLIKLGYKCISNVSNVMIFEIDGNDDRRDTFLWYLNSKGKEIVNEWQVVWTAYPDPVYEDDFPTK